MGGVPPIGMPVFPTTAEDFVPSTIGVSDISYVRRAKTSWLFSSDEVSSTFQIYAAFEFQGATGQLIKTASTIFFNRVTGVPTSVIDHGFSLDNPSVGPWAGAVRRWPVWEISGAYFRFFGQNWIRLIKVSGP